MRTLTELLAALALALVASQASAGAPPRPPTPAPWTAAQNPLRLPQASPGASVTQAVGPATVALEYHRPAVKNRPIWGALVPLGEVWRAGANQATTLRFSDAVRVEGHDVPAGTYAFFAIPGEKVWTLVLNKQADQWGAFRYDAAQDQLRFDVTPVAVPHTEWLRYSIEPKGDDSAVVQLAWEKLAVNFEIAVDSEKILLARIDEAIQHAKPDDAAVYLTAARYYYDHQLAPEKAMAWVDKSIAIADGYQARECKARLADRMGQKAEAVAQLERAIALATGKARPATVEALTKLLAEFRAK